MNLKKMVLGLSIATGLFATETNGFLDKNKTLSLLKAIPQSGQLINDYNSGKIKVYIKKKDGFYVILLKQGAREALIYLTGDKKNFIIGKVINIKKNKVLTIYPPVNANIVKNGISFTFGNGKKEIYLVTDPACPFCTRMYKKAGPEMAKNFKIHVILFPLPYHLHSKEMAYYVLAGKTDKEKAERLGGIYSGKKDWEKYTPTDKEKAKYDTELKKAAKAVEELGAPGTPFIYDSKFKPFTPLVVKKAEEKK